MQKCEWIHLIDGRVKNHKTMQVGFLQTWQDVVTLGRSY